MSVSIPSPRDWPEDAAHENGSYLCRCLSCKQTFTGYKRRQCCKVCANAMAETRAERVRLLEAANLSPTHWELMTHEEIGNMHRVYGDLSLQLTVERVIRRKLDNALTHTLATTSPRPGHRRLEVTDALEASRQLDTAPSLAQPEQVKPSEGHG